MERGIASVERDGRSVVISDTTLGTTPISPVSSDRALGILYDGRARQAYGWGNSPTANCWLSDLDKEPRLEICAARPAEWNGWKLSGIPSRELSVKRYAKKDGASTLYDLSGFWPRGSDLAEIAQTWGLDVPGIVARGESARGYEFPGWTDQEITEYAQSKSALVGTLASALFEKLTEHDLMPRRPSGIGAIGSKLLSETSHGRWIARFGPDRQPICDGQPMLDIFMRAYYGGRIETTSAGSLTIPGYRLDLRSAYLWALHHIGAVGMIWDHVRDFSPHDDDRMAVYHVSWSIPDCWIGPFPYRDYPKAPLYYPQEGEGWYWWPEVKAVLSVWGSDLIRVHEGYRSPRSSLRPYAHQAERLYQLRRFLDAENDPLSGVVKGAGNASYGKLAQQRGKDGRVGHYYNPALSGWVCSAVRGRLIDAMGAQGLDNPDTIAIMTDGLIQASEPDRAMLSDQLGGWRSERYERAEIIMPGFYRLHLADGRFSQATTRVSGRLDWEWFLDQLTAHGTAEISGRRFVPHILADLYPEHFERSRCRWRTISETLDPVTTLSNKRTDAPHLHGIDWRTTIRYLGADRRTPEPVPSASFRLPPAWGQNSYNPYREAAEYAERAG